MNFIHSREFLHAGDLVVVHCSHQCNLRLMDDINFASYRRGGAHHYHGGFFRFFPAQIAVPSDGWWNVTIDLGGRTANIRYSIRLIKRDVA